MKLLYEEFSQRNGWVEAKIAKRNKIVLSLAAIKKVLQQARFGKKQK